MDNHGSCSPSVQPITTTASRDVLIEQQQLPQQLPTVKRSAILPPTPNPTTEVLKTPQGRTHNLTPQQAIVQLLRPQEQLLFHETPTINTFVTKPRAPVPSATLSKLPVFTRPGSVAMPPHCLESNNTSADVHVDDTSNTDLLLPNMPQQQHPYSPAQQWQPHGQQQQQQQHIHHIPAENTLQSLYNTTSPPFSIHPAFSADDTQRSNPPFQSGADHPHINNTNTNNTLDGVNPNNQSCMTMLDALKLVPDDDLSGARTSLRGLPQDECHRPSYRRLSVDMTSAVGVARLERNNNNHDNNDNNGVARQEGEHTVVEQQQSSSHGPRPPSPPDVLSPHTQDLMI